MPTETDVPPRMREALETLAAELAREYIKSGVFLIGISGVRYRIAVQIEIPPN